MKLLGGSPKLPSKQFYENEGLDLFCKFILSPEKSVVNRKFTHGEEILGILDAEDQGWVNTKII